MKKFNSLAKNFARDHKGSVSMAFGFAAIPMLAAMGVAIDYSRLTAAQSDMQQAADAVSLDVANAWVGGNTQIVARATSFLKLNPPKGIDPNDITVHAALLPGGDKVKITLSTDVPLAFGEILGEGDDKTVTTDSTTTLPVFSTFHKGEIALVLDYSYSMNDYVGGVRKYISMRTEVNKLINSLSSNTTSADVKFGVVPFSAAVRTNMTRYYYYGQTNTGTMTTCIEDRKYPYNRTAATPTVSSGSTDRYHDTKFRQAANASCTDYSDANLNVRDLTTNHAGTVSAINAMGPVGNTHITLGAEIGWHMLTPNAPYTQGTAMHQADTLKAVVIFTDGMQTSGGNGPSNSNSVANAEANLAVICTAMKANGIRVFTVSFDLADASAGGSETRLRDCSGASSDDPARTPAQIAANPYPYYFNTETNADLATAFGTIRNQLARNMYLSE